MSDKSKYLQEEKISFRELVENVQRLFVFLLRQWKTIGLSVLLGGLLGFLYTLKKPTYTAETTFALEESSNLDQLSGLASSVGINVGGLGGGEEKLFGGENILELYTSKKMLIETLLTEVDYLGNKEKLIYPFARELEWDKKWESKKYLQGLTFDIPLTHYTHHHDSILLEVVEKLQDNFVAVTKPSRRLNIISVRVSFKDPVFAKLFNNQLVKVVNNFYYESKTRKSSETLATFQHQADSIRALINSSMLGIASSMESSPNMNAMYRTNTVPIQQKQIDLQVSMAAYSEIVKNLELAKLSHLERQPLIQVIDRPLNYLENNIWRWYKGLIIGFFLGGVLSAFFIVVKYVFQSEMNKG